MGKAGAGSRMYVFRDAHRVERGRDMVQALALELARLAATAQGTFSRRQRVLDALVRAGQVEAAFADAAERSPELRAAVRRAARITDALAEELIDRSPRATLPADVESYFGATAIPELVRVSPHEGFAYYALHPTSFADLAARALHSETRAMAVGIRSIGATLSAVVAGKLRAQGVLVQRMTVRPAGHPYARTLALDRASRARVQRANDGGSTFLVVDEGPGLSGSSFLAVGEALVACGVPSTRILFLCSRAVDPATLIAADARARWTEFRSLAPLSTACVPSTAGEYLVGDGWRRMVCGQPESRWPASWTQLERLKFLSRDRARILKFEGLAWYGAAALARAVALFEDGWGPQALDEGDGFVSYPFAGRPLDAGRCSETVLDAMARYCAARGRLFPASATDDGELVAMLRTNVLEEFGADLPSAWIPAVERAVLPDARMQPHEWVESTPGSLLKVDAVAHGDDHVFPGRTDIAWDLAGAIVEWGLDRNARDWFLARYRRASGDDPRPRIGAFLRAYAIFRMAYCKMAAAAVGPGLELDRFAREYRRYRALACPRILGVPPRRGALERGGE